MTEINTNSLSFMESPASWNTRYVDPNGFVCQFTLRDECGKALLEKVAAATAYLLKTGCRPYYFAKSSEGDRNATSEKRSVANPEEDNPAWCPIHQCEMTRWEKGDGKWYSHKVNGEWCKGK